MKPLGSSMNAAALALRLRLALRVASPVLLAALALGAAGLAALAWLLPARMALEEERAQARMLARAAAPAVPASLTDPRTDPRADPAASADANLALFYAALGERRYAEQGVKTLFEIAAKTGLNLRQGEYKSGYDRNGKLHTYQIDLPVQGSYGQVWRFALQALRAIPFASLDDISFKRDNIGQADVEARLRLTLYLSDAPAASAASPKSAVPGASP